MGIAAAADPPAVRVEVLLHQPDRRHCRCGVPGAVSVANSGDRQATAIVRLESPNGWRLRPRSAEAEEWGSPAVLTIVVPAGASSFVEFDAWTPGRLFVEDAELIVLAEGSVDGAPLEPVASRSLRITQRLCMVGESLCH
ncbi:MAG: hypothetical protein GC160_29635 [Acidobacteria bacterium]|nr:hypothetical protein [Acidobacteriota bacterium]